MRCIHPTAGHAPAAAALAGRRAGGRVHLHALRLRPPARSNRKQSQAEMIWSWRMRKEKAMSVYVCFVLCVLKFSETPKA